MRIVNVILTSVNGGAEKVFLDYCKILKERLDHDVYAIIKEDAPYDKKLDEIGVKYKKIKNKFGYHDIFAINSIKKALIEFDAQATISHAGRGSILTRKAIKKTKKDIHETCVNHSYNIKRSVGADMVFCVNKEIFYKVVDSGQDPKKAVIIHNATEIDKNLDNFKPNKVDFDKKEIIIGMLSRLDKNKGFLETLEAFNQISQNKTNKNFKLLIAGSGPFKKEIDEKIQQLNLQNKVEFYGWVEDIREFFNKIDIFLFPSLRNETFGISLIEAIRSSTPVICSNDFGPREIVRPDKDGIVVELDPAEKLSDRIYEAVTNLANNEEKAKEMTKSAYERLLKRFSFDNLEMNLKDLFGKIEK